MKCRFYAILATRDAVSRPKPARQRHARLGPTLWRTPWLWLALVIGLFCVPLFLGLGRTDLENDESIYLFAVEVMVTHGDWLTPKSLPSETDPFLEKPPLKF